MNSRSVATPWGELRVFRDDRMALTLAKDGVHEWAETALLPSLIFRGMDIVDVGAHVGYYTSLFSQLIGPMGNVIAIEPHPLSHNLLMENVGNLRLQNVTVVNCALAGVSRTETVSSEFPNSDAPISDAEKFNSGAWCPGKGENTYSPVEVLFETLDELLEKHEGKFSPGFIKIDIEGYELDALLGAQQTITRSHPRFMIEFLANNDADTLRLKEMHMLLQSLNYTVCEIAKKPWPHFATLALERLESPPFLFNAFAYHGHHDCHI